jgi:bifunctional non-homologous end joining protein LigD
MSNRPLKRGPAVARSTARDSSIRTYRAKRDFSVTTEPAPNETSRQSGAPIFVVQKHQAHRAGLHYDFRLEHDGVLWSWAVRKGPSLDPRDRHVAVHVEDHPLDYAGFAGDIPDGQYGAGNVEIWDRGTWHPLNDPDDGMRKGELTFALRGERLTGRFHLVRLRPKPGQRSRQDHWLLFKGHDKAERAGADATTIEHETKLPALPRRKATSKDPPRSGAKPGKLPARQSPQLCAVAEDPPSGDSWINEIKFDGYRLLAWLDHGKVRLLTRNGNDWTGRLPAVARMVTTLDADTALVDGELVALDADGISSFPELQAALSAGKDATLFFYVFDLLHLNGWDLRPCNLVDRKAALRALNDWRGMLRYSDHHVGNAIAVYREACRMKLEGIICKPAEQPYHAGRGHGWLKVKCRGRDEFVVLGWTPPRGSRRGLGSLHLGYYDHDHHLHYAGGVGTGFSDDELQVLRQKLDELASGRPRDLVVAGDPLDTSIQWVVPRLVAETQYMSWSGAGRVRQAVYLGLRDDKAAIDVVRDIADPKARRQTVHPKPPPDDAPHGPNIAMPPNRRAAAARIVTARPPKARTVEIAGVAMTHPERELWPGITKRDLAEYWVMVADHALPGLAKRPLAIMRCPDGIDGESFFQKNGRGTLPVGIREGRIATSPYLAIDDLHGLVGMAQISAIELHPWGAVEADPYHPDTLVFDLDPGEGVPFSDVVRAARDVRDRLGQLNMTSFCRTTGGKGLHVVVPIAQKADWEAVRLFCRGFAEMLSEEYPTRFLSTVKKADRRGRILLDWLRNGLGATAVASFCPRARPRAMVATPLAWDEVTEKLDPAMFTLRSVPERLGKLAFDPWAGFRELHQPLPDLARQTAPLRPAGGRRAGKAVTVKAPQTKRRA